MESRSIQPRDTSSNSAGLWNLPAIGQREARAIGQDLTRQARLRLDACQAERRLKIAYAALGEVVYGELMESCNVDVHDARVADLLAQIQYYQDELARLTAVGPVADR